ncbi:hypothetical protein [Buttiauxella agrestis]|uniref:hypothetical protein n=1 Tax=Buttiauxella agrestis TaxID=82977 RepID=UPI0015589994|nr:hypothetical protein [Buttiauxella agrestis]
MTSYQQTMISIENGTTQLPAAFICNVFGIHRCSYRYWLSRPQKPDAKQIVILSLVREVHHTSNGSARARSIADMVSAKGVPLSRWRASKIMKELNTNNLSS